LHSDRPAQHVDQLVGALVLQPPFGRREHRSDVEAGRFSPENGAPSPARCTRTTVSKNQWSASSRASTPRARTSTVRSNASRTSTSPSSCTNGSVRPTTGHHPPVRRPRLAPTESTRPAMLPSVQSPSCQGPGRRVCASTWDFTTRSLRTEGLAPPSISVAFPLVTALHWRLGESDVLEAFAKYLVDGHFRARWSWGCGAGGNRIALRPMPLSLVRGLRSPLVRTCFRVSVGGRE
jgi:hypothetical protein